MIPTSVQATFIPATALALTFKRIPQLKETFQVLWTSLRLSRLIILSLLLAVLRDSVTTVICTNCRTCHSTCFDLALLPDVLPTRDPSSFHMFPSS